MKDKYEAVQLHLVACPRHGGACVCLDPEPGNVLDRAGMSVFREVTFLTAGPAGERSRSAAEVNPKMKAVPIIIGSLGGLYAAFAIVQFLGTLIVSNPGTAYGGANIAASVFPVCLGLIVCLVCFRRAFRKPPTK